MPTGPMKMAVALVSIDMYSWMAMNGCHPPCFRTPMPSKRGLSVSGPLVARDNASQNDDNIRLCDIWWQQLDQLEWVFDKKCLKRETT